ncbi:MAG: prepilin-type N-terminal cleavage/methylation domain-containing protein [Candidatus Schekmanbacteria bacterium]|nr:prepilin-type N-terminal cleavage/methylation domain-containing protein [Candidatus Schekmanbacteria bacterium]
MEAVSRSQRSPRGEQGFSLLEVLIALVILVAASAAVFGLYPRAVTSMNQSQSRTTATRLAQTYLDEVGVQCFAVLVPANPRNLATLRGSVSGSETDFTVVQSYGEVPDPQSPNIVYNSYRMTVRIQKDTPVTEQALATVTVQWIDTTAGDNTLQFVRRLPNQSC